MEEEGTSYGVSQIANNPKKRSILHQYWSLNKLNNTMYHINNIRVSDNELDKSTNQLTITSEAS